jgi:acyl-coenzyme A thioesterase PaaI-like protein
MTTPSPTSSIFDLEFIAGLAAIFEERIPFNRVIGLRIASLEDGEATGHLAMRPELIGHDAQQRLHGGVISASLDAIGGLAVMTAISARHADETTAQRTQRFSKLGTIDLRIDYLRPRSASVSRCARRCCAWARESPRRGWSSAAPTASCSRPGPPRTSFRDRGGEREYAYVRAAAHRRALKETP